MSALSEINVTPLLDMCFCLLIIFMIATPVLEQTTQIDLPVASKAIATPPPKTTAPKPRTVSLDAAGRLVFDGREVSETTLRAELKRLAELPEAEQPMLHVRGDGQLRFQRVIDVFALIREARISKVSIDTEVKD